MGVTRNGALLGIGCAAAAGLSWLFGLPEVAALAAAGMVLLAAAVVWVRFGAPALEVTRAARPPRLELGETCEIRLVTHNAGRRTSPVMMLEDDVGRYGSARLELAPLAPGGRCVATYGLPTSRRGLHHVGPLTTTVEDPFGLARRSRRQTQVLSVIVLPRTSRLTTMPAAPGDEPEHGTHSLTSASTVDEEFAALRDYVPGDDVRRIHWRSTARRGAPVVRQFDVPWQRRTTVVLDLRAGTDEASFERAVSAAASVVLLAAGQEELVRLMTTDGTDSGYVPAAEHVDELLDRLAVVTVDPPRRDRPEPLLGLLGQLGSTDTGRVVTCTAGLTATDAAGLGRASRGIGLHVVVPTGSGSPTIGAPGIVVVAGDGRRPLSTEWEAAVGSPAPAGRT